MLPFTRDQFFQVFTDYNAALWPVSLAAYALGAAAVLSIITGHRYASRLVSAVLALIWAWTGIAYHYAFFAEINPAAVVFAALFVIEAALLIYHGVFRQRLIAQSWTGWRSGFGWLLIAYAGVAYPLIGLAAGHGYGDLPQFGDTPCPVVLFTFGMLLLMRKPVPWSVLVIPVIWSLIGGSAAILLNVPQDWVLLVSGIATLAVMRLSRS
jgi:hypothetical protein